MKMIMHPFFSALCKIPIVPFTAGSMSSGHLHVTRVRKKRRVAIITLGIKGTQVKRGRSVRDRVDVFHSFIKRTFLKSMPRFKKEMAMTNGIYLPL